MACEAMACSSLSSGHASVGKPVPGVSGGGGCLWKGFEGRAREERAHGAAQQHNVVARVDAAGKGGLVAVEAAEDLAQQRGRAMAGQGRGLAVAVELEELGEERQDKGEGDLPRDASVGRGARVGIGASTRSRRETTMTRSTLLRVAASTAAMMSSRPGLSYSSQCRALRCSG